jgi:uroporphyrinogen-III synthase
LIVRGGDAWGQMAGRDWLAQQLHARGVTVEFAVAYTRHAPVWTTDLRDTVLHYCEQQNEYDIVEIGLKTPEKNAIWVFSSSEAIENLREGVPQANWRGTVAVATHPRIAQSAAQAGFGRVLSSGGSLDAVIASIKSLA